MKRSKQLTFKSWELFRAWYTKMKETFTALTVSFIKILNQKHQTNTYCVVITY